MDEKVIIQSDTTYIQAWRQTSINILIGGAIATVLGLFIVVLLLPGLAALLVGVILFIFTALIRRTNLVVTDRRVYGTAAFGQRVDLPFDSISAVGMSWFKGIAVGTSSGKIKFLGISNRDDIHKVISDMLVMRQQQKASMQAKYAAPPYQGNADELAKYKKLLDDGVITQQEFDQKKKQLLGV